MSSATQPALIAPLARRDPDAAPQSSFAPPPRKWKFSTGGQRFLTLLDQQSALVVEGAHLLHPGPVEIRHDCSRQIESLCAKAEEGERHIAERLARSLITPLDSEDIRKIATLTRKLLARQAAVARGLATVPDELFRSQLVEIADASIRAAGSLANGVAALPRDPALFVHTRATASHARDAKRIVRDWAAGLLVANPLPVLMVMDRFLANSKSLFESYRLMAFTLERAFLKIS